MHILKILNNLIIIHFQKLQVIQNEEIPEPDEEEEINLLNVEELPPHFSLDE